MSLRHKIISQASSVILTPLFMNLGKDWNLFFYLLTKPETYIFVVAEGEWVELKKKTKGNTKKSGWTLQP